MKTNYKDYSNWDYIKYKISEKSNYLIRGAKESIMSQIEYYETECEEDEVDVNELARLKDIELDDIELSDVPDLINDDCLPDELNEIELLNEEMNVLEGNIDDVNSILAVLPQTDNIECSRKSESTYLEYPIQELNEFASNFGSIFNSNYYEELEKDELDELSTFKVRIACHDIGSYYDEYSNSSIKYSDDCINIIANNACLEFAKNLESNKGIKEYECENEMEF